MIPTEIESLISNNVKNVRTAPDFHGQLVIKVIHGIENHCKQNQICCRMSLHQMQIAQHMQICIDKHAALTYVKSWQ